MIIIPSKKIYTKNNNIIVDNNINTVNYNSDDVEYGFAPISDSMYSGSVYQLNADKTVSLSESFKQKSNSEIIDYDNYTYAIQRVNIDTSDYIYDYSVLEDIDNVYNAFATTYFNGNDYYDGTERNLPNYYKFSLVSNYAEIVDNKLYVDTPPKANVFILKELTTRNNLAIAVSYVIKEQRGSFLNALLSINPQITLKALSVINKTESYSYNNKYNKSAIFELPQNELCQKETAIYVSPKSQLEQVNLTLEISMTNYGLQIRSTQKNNDNVNKNVASDVTVGLNVNYLGNSHITVTIPKGRYISDRISIPGSALSQPILTLVYDNNGYPEIYPAFDEKYEYGVRETLSSTPIYGKNLIPIQKFVAQNIIDGYKNGKQTAKISCAVDDYYDENGNKIIDTATSDKPLFDIDDIVIPYVYTNKGDKPLSYNKDFTPKQFRVVGTKISDRQGGMQELTLLEE